MLYAISSLLVHFEILNICFFISFVKELTIYQYEFGKFAYQAISRLTNAILLLILIVIENLFYETYYLFFLNLNNINFNN